MRSRRVPRPPVSLTLALALALAAFASVAAGAARQGVWTWLDGPEGPITTAIAVDPADPRVVYAGTYLAGIYKTVDGGRGWSPLNRGLPSGQYVQGIAVDPHDPQKVFILATGGLAAGVSVSVDGGANWVPRPQGLLPALFDPRDDTMFAWRGPEVFASIDGGFTWDGVGGIPDASITSLARDAADPKVFFATSFRALYKSTDGGASFSTQETPIDFSRSGYVPTVLTDAAAPGTVYVASVAGIWKSVDSGASWSLAIHGLRGLRNHSWIVTKLVTVPSSPGTLLAVLTQPLSTRSELYRSDDGAATWADQGFFGVDGNSFLTLAASTSEVLFAGNPYLKPGVFKSGDGGRTWTKADNGLAGPIQGATFLPGAKGGLYAVGTYSTWKSADGGATWQDLKRRLDALQVDPVLPETLDAIQDGGFTTSADGGRTWSPVRHPSPYCRSLREILVAARPRPTLYALTGSDDRSCLDSPGLSSTDGGRTWREIPELAHAVDLVLDAADPSTLYAARYQEGDVIKSSDGGHRWTVIGPSPKSPNNGLPLHLVASPVSGELYLTLSDTAIFTSRDRGSSWQAVAPLPLAPFDQAVLVPDQQHAGRVYALGPKSLLRSDDGGKTWRSPARGLTRTTFVQALTIAPDGTLFVATNNGMFTLAPGPD